MGDSTGIQGFAAEANFISSNMIFQFLLPAESKMIIKCANKKSLQLSGL